MMSLDQGTLPIYRAYQTNADERLLREFILRLKLGRVTASYYIAKYGVDPRERFAPALTYLQSEGFLNVSGDVISLNREGLLQVDRLLHEFFLPQHRHARYT
jgi:oxygen-independent coproporphyrinogen-3 oxidase